MNKLARSFLLCSLSMSIMTGCTDNSSDSSDGGISGGPGIPGDPGFKPGETIRASNWAFDHTNPSFVSAAQVAGRYAVASSSSAHVEIRNINQVLKDSLSMSDILELVPDMNLSGDNGLCAMTLTPSGRFLYLAVCSDGSGKGKDAILAYNTNTKKLSVFDRVTLAENDTGRFGMTYFQGQLFVAGQIHEHSHFPRD